MTEEQVNKILELQYLIDKGSIDYREAVNDLPSDLNIEKIVTIKNLEDYTVNVTDPCIENMIKFLLDVQNSENCFLNIDIWGDRDYGFEIDFSKSLKSLETDEEYFNRLVRITTIAQTGLSIDKRKEQEEYELYLRLKEKFQ